MVRVGMVAAILVNGPLSQALQRTPSYWDAGAAASVQPRTSPTTPTSTRWSSSSPPSNVIFVFAIGFLAGLRQVPHRSSLSGWGRGVSRRPVPALFLAGGLLSETLSTGIAVVLHTTPDYHLDVNSALLLQGLWSSALAQGQVALAVVILTVSALALGACWPAPLARLVRNHRGRFADPPAPGPDHPT